MRSGPARYFVLVVLLLSAAVVTAFAARSLAGELYLLVARHSYIEQPAGQRAHAAASMAVRLEPWNASALSLLGESLRAQGKPLAGTERLRQALQAAPGDVLRWQDVYETALALDMPSLMQFALHQVSTLAPNSNELKMRNALLGLLYWDRGTAVMQKTWSADVRNSLIYRRKPFLYSVFQIKQEARLCRLFPASEKAHYYRNWCARATELRKFCVPSQPMTHDQKQYCRAIGADL